MAGGQASKANQRQSQRHKGGYNKYRNEMRREKSKLRRMRKHMLHLKEDGTPKHARDMPTHTAIDLLAKQLRAYM